ncbi:class I SAM-dependent methyltransferase [Inquilinus sp. CA228]|uniref:class I SAM-dependent methyltransferase n=1 Tax=Inquilinus sp. CA228 TaxID=3455609 RepID=UPI003F8D162A
MTERSVGEFLWKPCSSRSRCGLAHLVSFRQGSALAMPFPDTTFDAATLIHVGMNIADKAALFAEVRRVLKLKPGARFGVYEVMRMAEGELPYPMPWAAAPETSFVEPPETYRRLLRQAGFTIEAEHDRSELALRLGREARERAATRGPSPLGPHLLMGPGAPQRVANVMAAVERGLIAPVEIIARAG